MLDKKTLVFVEVRFRKNDAFGGGLESITHSKQKKLRITAELYLQQNNQHKNARFDVVSVSQNTQTKLNKQHYIFDWVTNAFWFTYITYTSRAELSSVQPLAVLHYGFNLTNK